MTLAISYSFKTEISKLIQQKRGIDMLSPDAARKYLDSLVEKDLEDC